MKKSTPWATAQAEYETRIRQDERVATLAGLWEHLHRLETRMVDLLKALEALKKHMPSANRDIEHEPIMTSGVAPKRRAVTATPEQVFAVHDALVQLHGVAVSIKNLRGATGVGPKTIGSALRALVQAGSVVEGPRGKFKAVEIHANNEARERPD